MATLVLSTVGQIVGGPIGAMVGSIIGQQIDQNIVFKPKAVHGPRLTELAVQASTYGAQIPRIYGRMRVAGQVIWATPLRETRHKQGGKGRPDQINYTYSASFAVALSSRRLRGVKRIWADGTLIRKSDGRWLRDAVMRFHDGGEDQPLDPLMASAIGMETTPAHRGLAYIVFEDLPLADYGNRIPSLTFEVEADAGEVDAADIAADLVPDIESAGPVFAMAGFAASGDSVRSALASLTEASGWSLSGRSLGRGGDVVALEAGAIQAAEDIPAIETSRGAEGALPASIAIRHYDPARDYQIGLQRARVAGGKAGRDMVADMPMVLEANAAKALAERLAARVDEEAHRIKVPVGPQALGLQPGCLLEVAGQAGLWRLERWNWEGDSATLDLVRASEGDVDPAVADSGIIQPSPEGASGALHLVLADLPGWHIAGASDRPLVAAFVASEVGRGSAMLSVMTAQGAEPQAIGRALDADALGYAQTVLGEGTPSLFDDVASVEVTLVNPDMQLTNASDAALLGGANVAVLGDELIQFGRAESLGGNLYRLSHLLRGRGGTETRTAGHEVGDAFVLLPEDPALMTLLPERIGLLPLQSGMIVEARHPGSDDVVIASLDEVGKALVPLAPVHVEVMLLDDGGLTISWIRRSRSGWSWNDGVDAPIGEAREDYVVVLEPSVGVIEEFAVNSTQLNLPNHVVTGWREAGVSSIRIRVSQTGSHARSLPGEINFPL